MLTKLTRWLRIRRRLIATRLARNADIRSLKKANQKPFSIPCPVCGTAALTLDLAYNDDEFTKGLCTHCEHIFSNWFQTNVDESSQLFGYSEENDGLNTQALMLAELSKLSKGNRFLDFGVGGNIRSISIAKSNFPNNEYWACDLYPHNCPTYFTTHDTSQIGTFAGISSYAVIEHLTDPIPLWQYMNKLLRPCAEGGGIMVHSFPSQYHHRIGDWQITIRSHTCLFSRKSLPLLLAKCGFKILSCDPPRPVGAHAHPVFVFAKTRDI